MAAAWHPPRPCCSQEAPAARPRCTPTPPSAPLSTPSLRRPFLHDDPARLLARFAVGSEGDPAVLLLRVGHAHIPARRLDTRKLRQQALEVLAHELGAARERDVLHVRR